MSWFLIVCLGLSLLVLIVLALYLIVGSILFTHFFAKRGKLRKKINISVVESEFFKDYKKIECENAEHLKLWLL